MTTLEDVKVGDTVYIQEFSYKDDSFVREIPRKVVRVTPKFVWTGPSIAAPTKWRKTGSATLRTGFHRRLLSATPFEK